MGLKAQKTILSGNLMGLPHEDISLINILFL
jgi:hypothetical protein